MLCPTCHGNQTVPIKRDGKIVGVQYCETCSGHGVVHCCEGDRACPDAPVDGSIGMEKEP